jgi:hypothetical protein
VFISKKFDKKQIKTTYSITHNRKLIRTPSIDYQKQQERPNQIEDCLSSSDEDNFMIPKKIDQQPLYIPPYIPQYMDLEGFINLNKSKRSKNK